MKKIISTVLTAVILLSCCVSAFATEDEGREFCLKIVHTNDIHSRVVENSKSGIIGVPKLKTLIDSHIKDSDMNFVLDSGDTYHGQSIATLVQGESIAQLIGDCGYDAMTAGNHDWNYGKDRLKELVKITDENDIRDFKMLTGNVINNDGTAFFDDEYLIKSVEKNGETLKVGVFGVIDPRIYSKISPSNVSGISFTDMKEYSEKAVDYLETQGCQLIIALTHSYSPVQLASSVDGVDLWLAGHEHIKLDETVTTPNGEKTRVVENGYYLYDVGLIELDFDLNENNEIENLEYKTSDKDYSLCAEVAPDDTVLSQLSKIQQAQSVILNRVVGTSPADLDGVWENLRIDETNLGRAVTDAYLLETGADVAFENAGGIRASINKGDVTYGDILSVMPYGNYIVTKQVSGQYLLDILETSIDIQIKSIEAYNSGVYDAWPTNSGSTLQIGGMTVKYDITKPFGERVQSAFVGSNPLDKESKYTVATNNFVAVSDVYPQLAQKEESGEFSACDEAFIKYFEQEPSAILGSVNTQRMIRVSSQPGTQPETNPTETTASISTAPAGTNPTSSTYDEPTTNNGTVSTPDTPNNGISTGADPMIYIAITLLLISASSIYFFRRRLNNK